MSETIDIIVEFDATSSGKMRNDISVTFASPPEDEVWELATDEGAFHGGDSTAPPPLALFAAAMAGCIMTQIRAFSKRMDVPIRGVSVTGRAKWFCHLDGRNPYRGEPNGFEMDIDLDTDASLEDQLRLVRAAKQGCFIEQTLVRENTVVRRLRNDGEFTPVD